MKNVIEIQLTFPGLYGPQQFPATPIQGSPVSYSQAVLPKTATVAAVEPPLRAHALARVNDPSTSKQAAAGHVASGNHARGKAAVLAALRMYDNSTAKELAQYSGLPYETVHKRLPDLRKDGVVRNGEAVFCNVSGLRSQQWIIGNAAVTCRPLSASK